MELELLINSIESLEEKDSELLRNIADYDLLIEALHDLKNMVEMNSVKNSIILQIKFLLVNSSNSNLNNNSNFDGHMLHTVLSGEPGVGKTDLGIILAKIWTSLGLINKNIKNSNNKSNINNNNNSHNTNKRIGELEKQIEVLYLTSQNKIEIIKKLQEKCEKFSDIISEFVTQIPNYKLKQLQREIKFVSVQNIQNTLSSVIIDNEKLKQKLLDSVTEKIKEEKIQFIQLNSKPKQDVTKQDVTKKENNNSIVQEKQIQEIPIQEKQEMPKQEKQENTEKEKCQQEKNIEFLDLLIKKIEEKNLEMVNNDKEIQPKNFSGIRIVGREDMVGAYQGQTALKTEKLLQDSLGKVLFIDEAYSLILDEKDSYGHECLATLNRFMSEHGDEIVIIFAGYKDFLENSIFKAQPGLKRRCTWFFDIPGYTEKGLAEIFTLQLEKTDWSIDNNINLTEFFSKYKTRFPYYGGDTLRLAFYCKLKYSEKIFEYSMNHIKKQDINDIKEVTEETKQQEQKDINNKTITLEMLESAMEYLKTSDNEKDKKHLTMYI